MGLGTSDSHTQTTNAMCNAADVGPDEIEQLRLDLERRVDELDRDRRRLDAELAGDVQQLLDIHRGRLEAIDFKRTGFVAALDGLQRPLA